MFGEATSQSSRTDDRDFRPASRFGICSRHLADGWGGPARFRDVAHQPRRSLAGPSLPAELPIMAAAAEAGELGEDHIGAVCERSTIRPHQVSPRDKDSATDAIATQGHRTREFVTTDRRDHRRLPQQTATSPTRTTPDAGASRWVVRVGQAMSQLLGWLDPETRSYLEAVTAAVRPADTSRRCAGDTGEARHPQSRTTLPRRLKLGSSGGLGIRRPGHRGVPIAVSLQRRSPNWNSSCRSCRRPGLAMPRPTRTGGGGRLPMRSDPVGANAIHYARGIRQPIRSSAVPRPEQRIATADHRMISATPATAVARNPVSSGPVYPAGSPRSTGMRAV